MRVIVDSKCAERFEGGELISRLPETIFLPEVALVKCEEYGFCLDENRTQREPWVYVISPIVVNSIACERYMKLLAVLSTDQNNQQIVNPAFVPTAVRSLNYIKLSFMTSNGEPFVFREAESFWCHLKFQC